LITWLLNNCDAEGTSNDFTADVVRVRLDGNWIDMAKVGRRPCDNPLLERVPLHQAIGGRTDAALPPTAYRLARAGLSL